MISKKEQLVKEIRQAIGGSKYMVIINGIVRKHSGNPVYVKAGTEGELIFYIKNRVGEIFMENQVDGLGDKILMSVCSSILFDRDFTKWSQNWSESKGTYFMNVKVNSNLRMLYLETDMYNLFRNSVPNQESLNISFTPTINSGQELRREELAALSNAFRMNGFRSVLELAQLRLLTSVRRKIRPFYRIDEVFFPAMLRSPEIFNPFFDDRIIYDQVKDRALFRMILERGKFVKDTGILTSFMTNRQVSECLGLRKLVPFNFEILFNLLVGMVMDVRSVDYEFPHKDKRIMRLPRPVEGLEPLETMESWNNLSDDDKVMYLPSSTYNTYLSKNRQFF